MDYRSNEDYYYRNNGYRATLGNGLYNSTHSTNINWAAVGNPEPVTYEEMITWGKIDSNAEASLIDSLIVASRAMVEQYTNTGLIARAITADINNANGGFTLPYGPVNDTPTAVDWQGTALTIEYYFDQLQTPLGRMRITYTGGFAAGTVPEIYKTAIMQQCLYMYENRGDIEVSQRLSPMVQVILNPLIRSK